VHPVDGGEIFTCAGIFCAREDALRVGPVVFESCVGFIVVLDVSGKMAGEEGGHIVRSRAVLDALPGCWSLILEMIKMLMS
jgi:hypothetical protein